VTVLVAPWSLERIPMPQAIRRSLGRLQILIRATRKLPASGHRQERRANDDHRGNGSFMGAVGVARFFLGGLGVMNVMLVSVRERTAKSAVRRRSVNAESILRQFFLETVIVVGLTAAPGLLLSTVFCAW